MFTNMCRGERGTRRFPHPGRLATVVKPIMGLVTDVMPFHCSCTLCKCRPPGIAIGFHLAIGVGACVVAVHMRPT